MSLARKLLHTRYRINDLERTVKFYREVLGLEEVRRHKSPRGSELAFLKAPESEELIEICYFPASEPVQVQPDLTHLAFEVDDIYALCAQLKDAGVTINRPPRDGRMAFVRSPDNISVELLQKGPSLPKQEPWASMENTGSW